MTAQEVADFLHTHKPARNDVTAKTGRRDTAAFVRLEKAETPEKWAVVSSPGDRWFSLDIDGGFATTYFDEDTPVSVAEQTLSRLLEAAVAYLDQLPEPTTSRLLRTQSVVVSTETGPLTLRRSLTGDLRYLKSKLKRR